ncbi:Twin-arginine translocation protein TatB [hydrothermal vent metagenome]|uniref:Twin-arginine translocation protein TatB n=1 Tax=hydrothermal vent metagenome TaxID=652676 RepID=A0A3B0TFU2_9ZZZZ
MFDVGWTEMLVISVIALLVVGPKDLPRMLRTLGQYIGKAKRMAGDFRSQFDDAVRDADLDEVRKSFDDLKSGNPSGEISKALSPLMEAADDLKKTVDESNRDDDATPASEKDDDIAERAGENSISQSAASTEEAAADPEPAPAPKEELAEVEISPPDTPEPAKKAAAANG